MGDVKVLEDKLRLALKCKCKQERVVYESIVFYCTNRTDCVKYARMQVFRPVFSRVGTEGTIFSHILCTDWQCTDQVETCKVSECFNLLYTCARIRDADPFHQ